MKKITFILLAICFSFSVYGQRTYTDYGAIDVQNYEFHITVNDDNNNIQAETKFTLISKKAIDSFKLDLENTDENNKGMVVNSITESGSPIKFEHQNNTLTVYSKSNVGEQKTYTIKYQVQYYC